MAEKTQAPGGALREAAKDALGRLEVYAADHCWPVDRSICDRLRAALAAQPETESFHASSFIQHVQSVADGGHSWADEFIKWYSPGEWLSEERAAAVFVGQKIAALAAQQQQQQQQQSTNLGCGHCRHPLYAGVKCGACGRVTEQALAESTPAECRAALAAQPAVWTPEQIARTKELAATIADKGLPRPVADADQSPAEMAHAVCDQIIPVGFSVEHCSPADWMTDEENAARRWIVKRNEPPMCDEDDNRAWFGPTLSDAIGNACKALGMAVPDVRPRCVCGEPTSAGVVHRTDGPCYMAAPAPAEGDLTDEQIVALFEPTDIGDASEFHGTARVVFLDEAVALVRRILAERATNVQPKGTEARESDRQLMDFYSVESLCALIDAQEEHIRRLQEKLPPLNQPAFTRVREG